MARVDRPSAEKTRRGEITKAALAASADNPDVQQILLIDGPAVLGWDRWRSLEADYGLGVITAMLDAAVTQGVIPRQPAGPVE